MAPRAYGAARQSGCDQATTAGIIVAVIAPDLPGRYSARPLRVDDAQRVTNLMAAYEERVLGAVLVELEDIQGDWRRPSADLGSLTTGIFDGERMVAYGEVSAAERCEAYVHPDHWGRGLGAALLAWSERVARERGLGHVGQTIPDADEAAQALCARFGYQRRYTSWVLALPANSTLPPVELPAGYALRDFEAGADERAAFRVIEEAFNEWEGRPPQSYGDWAARVLERPGFESWQLRLVAAPAGDVVAACLLRLTEDAGWVDQLAVQREHRGRGLAQALLSDAFGTARAGGRDGAELSTDSRTGALGLYEHVGMQVKSAHTHWALRL